MNKYSLNLLVANVKNIDDQLKKTETELKTIFEMDSDRRKVQNLIEVASELQVELDFTQVAMQDVIDKELQKKFWQFWK